MDKYILIILVIFILYYTYTKVFGKLQLNFEHFTDFKKDAIILNNDLNDCIDDNPKFHKYFKNKHHNYISYTTENGDNSYIILTTPSLYLTNNALIQSYSPYLNYIKQTMNIDHIIEQLRFNVYKFKDNNMTDLIGIVPEYILEDLYNKQKNKTRTIDAIFNADTMITHDINIRSKPDTDIFEYIRYIGGVSYTYYFFIIPIGSKIYSMSDFNNFKDGSDFKTIYIIYDDKMIQNIINKNNIETKLKQEYLNDSSLKFIKDYVKFVSGSDIIFEPLSLLNINSKIYNDDGLSNNNVILGNNNYSMDILNKFNFMEGNKFQIFGFDEHDNTLFDNDKSTDIGNYKSDRDKRDYKVRHQQLEEEEDSYYARIPNEMNKLSNYYDVGEEDKEDFYYDNFLKGENISKTYIERKTKQLLDFYKLKNTLIENVHVNDILSKHELNCGNYDHIDLYNKNINNKDMIKRDIEITNAQKSGYDYCREVRGSHRKQHFNKNIYFPIKTFLFRNIAITHKYTNDKYIYNFLYIFMKKLDVDYKLSLMSLNTNIDIHKGAHLFYKNYGFISNINNVDCVYNVGKRKCTKRIRNKFAP